MTRRILAACALAIGLFAACSSPIPHPACGTTPGFCPNSSASPTPATPLPF